MRDRLLAAQEGAAQRSGTLPGVWGDRERRGRLGAAPGRTTASAERPRWRARRLGAEPGSTLGLSILRFLFPGLLWAAHVHHEVRLARLLGEQQLDGAGGALEVGELE